MSYEALYIEKGGVTLYIPLCDCLPTLINFQLLYDCYIHYRHVKFHWTRCYIQFAHVPM